MVHALQEAHRVLKTNGILVDLRPGVVHRQVGIAHDGRYRVIGALHEKFDEDRAANRAVAQVLRNGLFKAEWRMQFDCPRIMDTVADFRVWMDEFIQLANLSSHDGLIQKVERAFHATRGKRKIVVRGPLVMRTLRVRR